MVIKNIINTIIIWITKIKCINQIIKQMTTINKTTIRIDKTKTSLWKTKILIDKIIKIITEIRMVWINTKMDNTINKAFNIKKIKITMNKIYH